MTVSSQTVSLVVNTMLAHKKDFTTDELIQATSLSRSSVRQAISVAQMQKSVIKVPGSYPAKFKVIDKLPQVGETLIIKEIAPPPELNTEMMRNIRLLIAQEKFNDTLDNQLAKFYRESTPAKRTQLKDFLINFAQVIKDDLEASKSLNLDDIKIGKK